MKLTRQVVLTAIIPLILVLTAGVVLLDGALRQQQVLVQREDSLKQQVIQSRLDALIRHLEAASVILAHSREASRAVQERDVNTLHVLGRQYAPLKLDKIIYLDLDGRVLNRSYDRYRFGDDLSDLSPVAGLLNARDLAQATLAGLFDLEGELHYAIARPVLLYGEVPVGLVISSLKINPALLQELVSGTGTGLVLSVEGFQVATAGSGHESSIRQRMPLLLPARNGGLALSDLSLEYPEDQAIHTLDLLSWQIPLLLAALMLLLPLLLSLILRRYLKPYAALVDGLQLLSGQQGDLAGVRQRMVTGFRDAPQEIRSVAQAIGSMTQRLEQQMGALQRLSITDQLTGLYNRRHVEQELQRELQRAQRYGGPLSLLIVDVDNFKQINDRLGHQEGDRYLQALATLFRANCRQNDLVGRWGGEEFLLLCPELTLEGALSLAEKLRRLVQDHCVPLLPEPAQIAGVGTLSIGVAQLDLPEGSGSLIYRADQALYRAKVAGRNCVQAGYTGCEQTETESLAP